MRFSNVSAHHCQLTVNGGYWHVRDLKSRNGVKVNGVRVTEKRLDPGDMLSVAKHKYEVKYSPVDLGAVGPPPPEVAGGRRLRQVAAGAGRVWSGGRSCKAPPAAGDPTTSRSATTSTNDEPGPDQAEPSRR